MLFSHAKLCIFICNINDVHIGFFFTSVSRLFFSFQRRNEVELCKYYTLIIYYFFSISWAIIIRYHCFFLCSSDTKDVLINILIQWTFDIWFEEQMCTTEESLLYTYHLRQTHSKWNWMLKMGATKLKHQKHW